MKELRLNHAAWTVYRFMHGYTPVYPVWHQIVFIKRFVTIHGDINPLL